MQDFSVSSDFVLTRTTWDCSISNCANPLQQSPKLTFLPILKTVLLNTSHSERWWSNLSQKGNKIFWDIKPFGNEKQLRTLREIVMPSFLGSCSPDESFDYQSTWRNFPLDWNFRNAAVRTSNFAVIDNTSIVRNIDIPKHLFYIRSGTKFFIKNFN